MSVGADAFLWPTNSPLMLAALSATCVGAAGNVLNDVFDVNTDRINRPSRPLAAGVLRPSHAWVLWAVLSFVGIAAAVLISTAHLAIALVSTVLVTAYNTRLKSTPLVGNLVVSVVIATAFLYGALSVGGLGPVVPAAVFAFLVNTAREVLKDIQDVAGDSSAGVSTYATLCGSEAAARLAIAILLATVGLTIIPFLLLQYSGTYLLLILIADGMMLAGAWTAMGPDMAIRAGTASRWTKMAMVVGLLALAVANTTTV